MGLWKKPSNNTNVGQQLDVKQLIARLKLIAEQNDIEITQLAIQSVIDELEDNKGAF